MAKYRVLFELQMKTAFRLLPKMIAMTTIFGVLVVLVGICGTKMLDRSQNSECYNIAIVLPDDGNAYTKLAFDFLGEVDTLKDVCNFIQMDSDRAYKGLNDGSLFAIILVPDNFVNHIMDGTNTPAKIILPQSGVYSKSALFRELVKAGSTDLSTAQAGIYAVDDVCSQYGIPDGVTQSEDYLNIQYFSYALNRSIYFDIVEVSATGTLNAVQFYIGTGIVLFLLLSGICCMDILQRENIGLIVSLKRRGIQTWILFLNKIVSVSLVYYVIIVLLYGCTRVVGIRVNVLWNIIPSIGIGSLTALFVMILSIFAMVHLVFQLTNNEISGVLLLFTLSIVMIIASGGLIPKALLPAFIQKISGFVPTTYYLALCRQILTNCIQEATMIANMIWMTGCIIAAMFIDYMRFRNGVDT